MKRTDTILDQIVAARQRSLQAQKLKRPLKQLEKKLNHLSSFAGPGFYDALKGRGTRIKVIAEVKQASPSGGILRPSFMLEEINNAYQSAPQVTAISVITESDHFKGDNTVLGFFAEHNTHKKPLLRKDFIFDSYQILESKLLGAQAYLLIAALLKPQELDELVNLGLSIGIEPLVEVHDEKELSMVIATKARVIGVNARDLRTFQVNVKRHELLKQLDESYAKVAESGIKSSEYLGYLSTFADAALIGSHFMQSADISAAINELMAPVNVGKSE